MVSEDAASLIGSAVKNSLENAIVAVSRDQTAGKKQGPDDSAGGASKPSKLKLRKKVDTKILRHPPVCQVRPAEEPSTVASASALDVTKIFFTKDEVALLLWQQVQTKQNPFMSAPVNIPELKAMNAPELKAPESMTPVATKTNAPECEAPESTAPVATNTNASECKAPEPMAPVHESKAPESTVPVVTNMNAPERKAPVATNTNAPKREAPERFLL